MPNGAKRWCFTINNPSEEDKFWLRDRVLDNVQYLVLQEERGEEEETLHWQGFIILKDRKSLAWLKRELNQRAHWEVTRGTNEEAANYCKKDATYTGGLRFEYGEMPARAAVGKAADRLQAAAEQLDILKEGYKRPSEIPSLTLLQCGFIPAMRELTADVLGPHRPDLRIITVVGPPGCGKSYAGNMQWQDHGRCIMGNNGVWFQNPISDVMFFEEFCGQIQLQRMLTYLDPYPMALEVKGGMRPAMYRTVYITSNSPPSEWYTMADGKREAAIYALWDRLGYSYGTFIPKRTCGIYLEVPSGITTEEARTWVWNNICRYTGVDPIEDDDSDPQRNDQASYYEEAEAEGG